MKKKKILKTLLITSIASATMLTVIPKKTQAYTNHTQSEAINWACDKGNTSWCVDVDGAYGCQCVDLILAYYDYLAGYHVSGNACDYTSNALPAGWTRVYGSPRAGDIVVWGPGVAMGWYPLHTCYAHETYGHIGIVWKVNDSGTIGTIETNVAGNQYAGYFERYTDNVACYIRPDFSTIKDDLAPIQNFGDDFYAYMIMSNNLELFNVDVNGTVLLQKGIWRDPKQIWHFIRQSDGSYMIINAETGRYLDVTNQNDCDGGQISTCAYTGLPAQKYYLSGTQDKCIMRPECSKIRVVSVDGGVNLAGCKLNMWEYWGVETQFFNIWKVNEAKASVLNYSIEKNNVTLNWSAGADVENYNIIIKSGTPGNVTEYRRISDILETSYTIMDMPAGYYEVSVEGCNYFSNAQSNIVNFNVEEQRTDISNAEITFTKTPSGEVTYNGKERTLAVKVEVDGKELTKNVDYTVKYSDNKNAGIATVTVEGIENYKGISTKTFTIRPLNVSNGNVKYITSETGTFIHTGNEIKPKIEFEVDGISLVNGEDYTIDYMNNVDVGNGILVINGKGNYTGTKGIVFTIRDAINLKDAEVNFIKTPSGEVTYNGKARTLAVEVKINGKTLIENTDYTVEYTDNTNAGTATVTITGKGEYIGTKTKTFTIKPLTVANGSIRYTIATTGVLTYNGKERKPAVEVKVNNKVLEANKDYTVQYMNNVNVGTGIVLVKGIGNYTGAKTNTFTIKPAAVDISNAEVNFTKTPSGVVTYNGKTRTLAVEVKVNGKVLTENTDYTLQYSNNTNAGTATVKITGKGSYTGIKTKTFTIKPLTVANGSIRYTIATTGVLSYNGKERKPAIEVKVNNTVLEANKDYTVEYTNNINPGTGKVTVKGMGNYTGTLSKTFTIKETKINIEGAEISFTKTPSGVYTYNGKERRPIIEVKVNGRVLEKNTDYVCTYANNIEVGTATLTITGKGNYTGTVSKNYTIVPDIKDISSAEVRFTKTPSGEVVYNGKARTLAVEVKVDGNVLKANTDYTVEYYDNTNVGTAVVMIYGTGNYTGMVAKTFTIKQRSLSNAEIVYTKTPSGVYTYNGNERKPAIAVNIGGVTLEANKDYTVEYSNNKEVGIGTVKVIGKGNYCDTVSRMFEIVK